MAGERNNGEKDDLRKRITHLENTIKETRESLKKIESAVVDDDSIGREGIGTRMKKLEVRTERVENFVKSARRYGAIAGGFASAVGWFLFYYAPQIFDAIRSFFGKP